MSEALKASIRNKFLAIYDDKVVHNEEADTKYEALNKYYDRMFKVVDTQLKSLY